MELRVYNGRLKSAAAFKLVAVGYFVGVTAMLIPVGIVFAAFGVASGAEIFAGGVAGMVVTLTAISAIIAGQSLLLGCIVTFGLWLGRRHFPIRVVAEPEGGSV